MNAEVDNGRQEHDDQVVQLIAANQRPLFLYIWGLLFSRESAEDVLQETNVVLWQKRAEYELGTNFFAWACRIAYFKVCKARELNRHKMPAFSDVFVQQMAPQVQAIAESPSQLQDYLQECMQKLGVQDRDLLTRRYEDDSATKDIAGALGQSVRKVNRSLCRIHQSLFECINAKFSEEGRR